MKKKALVLTSLLMMSTGLQAATEISGVSVPDSITPQGENLQFNGAGIRSKFFIDLYVGSLFTSEKMNQGNDVINSAEAAAIRLNITSNMITSEKMIKAMKEGFELVTADQNNNLDTKIADFIDTFAEPIKKGDQFTLLSVPGEGLINYKNGEFMSITPGEDFRKAVLAIWLGDKPTDKSLKKDMLQS
ncbi:MAG: chalcone isomerase family protein [Moritella sp.]|uniref:chalcone isomerase family protein n=1 Tax=Moritella sp. TaxID=78556 RepID=UPI0029B26DEC|nr:chalcone isomerase family protein [Moritella sp.]MDX2319815.1 chalcone isomerase family protein [Moritella sp.]